MLIHTLYCSRLIQRATFKTAYAYTYCDGDGLTGVLDASTGKCQLKAFDDNGLGYFNSESVYII